MATAVKNPPAIAGDTDPIPGSRRSSGGGSGNPLQYYFLENFMDRGAWQATVHGVAKSCTRLSDFHFLQNFLGFLIKIFIFPDAVILIKK